MHTLIPGTRTSSRLPPAGVVGDLTSRGRSRCRAHRAPGELPNPVAVLEVDQGRSVARRAPPKRKRTAHKAPCPETRAGASVGALVLDRSNGTPAEAFRGIVPMQVTPFGNDSAPALEELAATIQWQVGLGIGSLSALGMAGEFYKLATDELEAVISCVVEAAARCYTVVGVSAASAEVAARLARSPRPRRSLQRRGPRASPPRFYRSKAPEPSAAPVRLEQVKLRSGASSSRVRRCRRLIRRSERSAARLPVCRTGVVFAVPNPPACPFRGGQFHLVEKWIVRPL
jgi:hypothetical protein